MSRDEINVYNPPIRYGIGTAAHRLAEHYGPAMNRLDRGGRLVTDDPPPWADEPGVERFGGEPPVGTVLRWTPPRGEVPTMLAVRHDDGWRITGTGSGQSWPTVAWLVGDHPCQVAIGWREIPTPEPEPSGDDAVRDWAARFIAPQRSLADDGRGVMGEAATAARAADGADRTGWKVRCRACSRVLSVSSSASVLPDHTHPASASECAASGRPIGSAAQSVPTADPIDRPDHESDGGPAPGAPGGGA